MLAVADGAIPGLQAAAHLPNLARRSLSSTLPRKWGWVGGFPQAQPLPGLAAPADGTGLWMVGDSVFPGQSTAAVALGGMRVAEGVGIGVRRLGVRSCG